MYHKPVGDFSDHQAKGDCVQGRMLLEDVLLALARYDVGRYDGQTERDGRRQHARSLIVLFSQIVSLRRFQRFLKVINQAKSDREIKRNTSSMIEMGHITATVDPFLPAPPRRMTLR